MNWINRRAHRVIAIGLGLILLSSVLWYCFFNSNYFPIRKIDVQADTVHLVPAEIQAIVEPYIQRGLLGVNVRQLRQALLHLPWVETVSVARIWPDRIKIEVQEKQVIAHWGKLGLITNHSELFIPPKAVQIASLPQLIGPAEERQDVLQVFQKLRTMLESHQLGIAELALSTSHAWTLRLDNGIDVLLGHNDPVPLVQRWLKVYDQTLADKVLEVAQVDLRYPSGMAVKWQARKNKTS